MTFRAVSDACVGLDHSKCSGTALWVGLRVYCKCACHQLDVFKKLALKAEPRPRRAMEDWE
jgi:hypothetical protein